MPRIWCGECNREFSDTQYFTQHLNGKVNRSCQNAFISKKRRTTSPGLSVPINRRYGEAERLRTIREVEAVLEESNLEADRLSEAKAAVDYSVFDFKDSDEESDEEILDSESEERKSEEYTLNKGAIGDKFESEDKVSREKLKIDQFREYVEWAHTNNADLSPERKAAIELMHLMNTKGGSLELYKEIFGWHMAHLKTEFIVSSDNLHKYLIKRYNLADTMPIELRTRLPYSEATVDIVTHNCTAQTVDLITDPRIAEEDYLFFDGDPRNGPPEEWTTVGDINTGRAYRETYKKLIEPEPITPDGRIKVLNGYVLYLDACVTGHFGGLSMEILKFSSTLLNANARKKDWAWRNLGYVQTVLPQAGQAAELISGSQHVDAAKYLQQARVTDDSDIPTPFFDSSLYCNDIDDPECEEVEEEDLPEIALQDLHKMLQVILSSYKEMENAGGIPFDKWHNGELLRLQLIPFIILVRVDGVEADKLCGHYGPKTKNIKCICRQCICPTNKSDQAYRNDALKTQFMIQHYIKTNNLEKLQKISQHPIWNAFYELRFGLHNNHGIHQATPLDHLHWLLLGQNKYGRNSLFEQTGPDSKLTKNLDAVATSVGFLFKRQSDRLRPRTMFSKGVQKGKLMGHEMTGVLLVLAVTLRCTRGRRYILEEARGKQKQFLPDERFIMDWIQLLETMLQFGQWLLQDEMDVSTVERAKVKLREYMNMTKRIGKRQKGMGYKTMNFHGTKHIADSILDFGVCNNFNTFHNERHHKRDKGSAKRTNRRPGTFDVSVAKKIVHRTAIDLAVEELKGRKRWYYFSGFDHSDRYSDNKKSNSFEPYLTGVKAKFFVKEGEDTWSQQVLSQMSNKNLYKYDVVTQLAIHDVAAFVEEFLPELFVHEILVVYDTEAENNRQMYYGSPYHQGHPWHDWAIFDLSTPKEPNERNYVPGQIKCLIDLRKLPVESYDKVKKEPGIYALVETAIMNEDPNELGLSEIFEPWIKEPQRRPEYADQFNRLEMVNVQKIIGPAILIPDLDNPDRRAYLKMSPMSTWADDFNEWLNTEHTRDFDQPQRKINT